ncbi:MAG: hypothetical protein HXL00_02745 [Candidatus Nanosynbacter sp.]|jgi:hypothetical protein|nr:hypothetical protein [Candidatus Nanosynbacter sp.]
MKLSRLILTIAIVIIAAWLLGAALKLAAWIINGLLSLAAIVVIIWLIMMFIESRKQK